MSYAIISLGGKQYRVREGQRLLVDRLPTEDGKTFTPDVLLVGGEGEARVGRPTVSGAAVEGEIVAQGRHRKVVHFRKQKEGWTKKRGHRQPFTEVKITSVHA